MTLETLDCVWDSEGFLDTMPQKGELIRQGHAAGRDAAVPLDADGIAFLGMGFSGLAGDLVHDALGRATDWPLMSVKHYKLPRQVRRDWHVLSISHSGNTEETLALTEQALERGCGVTAFTVGGALENACSHIVRQPGHLQPRAATGHTWASLLGFLEGAGVTGRIPVDGMRKAVASVDRTNGIHVPYEENQAMQWAATLRDRVPMVYSTPAFATVGRAFRGLLNENAKKIAHDLVLPEANHNDLTAWSDPNRSQYAVACLHHAEQHPQLAKRITYMRERYGAWGLPWLDHMSPAIHTFEDHVIEQARAKQFLEYVSIYTALMRQQDPADITEIKALKASLAS